jgi:hypothetical protein
MRIFLGTYMNSKRYFFLLLGIGPLSGYSAQAMVTQIKQRAREYLDKWRHEALENQDSRFAPVNNIITSNEIDPEKQGQDLADKIGHVQEGSTADIVYSSKNESAEEKLRKNIQSRGKFHGITFTVDPDRLPENVTVALIITQSKKTKDNKKFEAKL